MRDVWIRANWVTGKIWIRSCSGEIHNHDVFILSIISPPFKPCRPTTSPITFKKSYSSGKCLTHLINRFNVINHFILIAKVVSVPKRKVHYSSICICPSSIYSTFHFQFSSLLLGFHFSNIVTGSVFSSQYLQNSSLILLQCSCSLSSLSLSNFSLFLLSLAVSWTAKEIRLFIFACAVLMVSCSCAERQEEQRVLA
jgi:hypothetical protein